MGNVWHGVDSATQGGHWDGGLPAVERVEGTSKRHLAILLPMTSVTIVPVSNGILAQTNVVVGC